MFDPIGVKRSTLITQLSLNVLLNSWEAPGLKGVVETERIVQSRFKNHLNFKLVSWISCLGSKQRRQTAAWPWHRSFSVSMTLKAPDLLNGLRGSPLWQKVFLSPIAEGGDEGDWSQWGLTRGKAESTANCWVPCLPSGSSQWLPHYMRVLNVAYQCLFTFGRGL